ncbi:MAG: GNAT family N-acetyltransferase [Nitrospirae bacterium]|nr:GNAT family N-acetyltransferase [Nitrospirota bacterium]MBI5694779.1 GNAT family N-acetyltransferase [Nitrospirota bacterium]
MDSIRVWRNSQMEVLRQGRPLTEADQASYYENAVLPSMVQERPGMVLFSYLLDGSCIGYGGFTNIHWTSRRAELSFLLDTFRGRDTALYTREFSVFLGLMKLVAFRALGFNRLFTETYDIRPCHVAVLEDSGFRLEGRMLQHELIDGAYVDSLIHGYLKEYYDTEG